jgi:hypothetical protein
MRVLFVGEGAHDIGPASFDPQPRPAKGAIPTLARRVCPAMAEDSVALAWCELPVLNEKKRTRGLAAKVETAIVIGASKFRVDGTVCVTDRDRDEPRLSAMEAGQSRGLAVVGVPHVAACGVAVESVEAWTLGAPEALADFLGVDVRQVQEHYRLRDVEDYYQRSGNDDHRPKKILSRVLASAHQVDCAEVRESVAERTDIAALERNCPQGFRPFAQRLRAVFGPR